MPLKRLKAGLKVEKEYQKVKLLEEPQKQSKCSGVQRYSIVHFSPSSESTMKTPTLSYATTSL